MKREIGRKMVESKL